MKNIFFLLVVIIAFGSCSKDEPLDESYKMIGEWSLINIGGGISGLSCDYDEGIIVWTFSDRNVTIKNEPALFSDCVPTQSNNLMTFSTITNSKGLFLVINNIEMGSITFTEDGYILNPNEHSEWDNADAAVWVFKKS